ncbi:hypothetical protein TYRP_018262 [Tyrophagus putrescentiae]|nr:hypothetical protein TYRP_018262 [Tyrophagus putrescentiae]
MDYNVIERQKPHNSNLTYNCGNHSVGNEGTAENRVFAAAATAAAKTKLKQPKKKSPPTTSPFYEALKTILASTPAEEEDNAAPLETDDSGVYSVLSCEL